MSEWHKIKIKKGHQLSYKTKEMNPKKFAKTVYYPDFNNGRYNFPDGFFDKYDCSDCKNCDKCPQDIRSYHELEASINIATGQKGYGLSAPAWCMGTCGYQHFEFDPDELLEEK